MFLILRDKFWKYVCLHNKTVGFKFMFEDKILLEPQVSMGGEGIHCNHEYQKARRTLVLEALSVGIYCLDITCVPQVLHPIFSTVDKIFVDK